MLLHAQQQQEYESLYTFSYMWEYHKFTNIKISIIKLSAHLY